MDQNRTSYTLLQRATSHDEKAWSRLVALYSPLIYHWCRRGGVMGEDIHDVVQEVFQGLLGSLDSFDDTRGPGAFRKWVRGITRFKVVDHLRKRSLQPVAAGGSDVLQMLQEVPGALDDSEEDSQSELNGLYHRALELIRADFEEHTWQAFWRTGVENQSVAAAAAELGMTAMAVRQAKSRVLRRLKEEVGNLVS
jgi:RNA polymerase sigma-70 factor (ECF subfamily)